MVQAVMANLRKDQPFWAGEPEIVSEVNAIESEFNLCNPRHEYNFRPRNNRFYPIEKQHLRYNYSLYLQALQKNVCLCAPSKRYGTPAITSLNNHLTILDDMIEGFIEDDDMIARYKSARIIIDYGKGKTARNKTEPVGTETSVN